MEKLQFAIISNYEKDLSSDTSVPFDYTQQHQLSELRQKGYEVSMGMPILDLNVKPLNDDIVIYDKFDKLVYDFVQANLVHGFELKDILMHVCEFHNNFIFVSICGNTFTIVPDNLLDDVMSDVINTYATTITTVRQYDNTEDILLARFNKMMRECMAKFTTGTIIVSVNNDHLKLENSLYVCEILLMENDIVYGRTIEEHVMFGKYLKKFYDHTAGVILRVDTEQYMNGSMVEEMYAFHLHEDYRIVNVPCSELSDRYMADLTSNRQNVVLRDMKGNLICVEDLEE